MGAARNLEAELVQLLERHVSRVLAESIARRAVAVGGEDRNRTLEELRVRVRLFLDPDAATAVLDELGFSSGVRARPGAERIEIRGDADVTRARVRARQAAQSLGAGAFGAQRVSNAVGELAHLIAANGGRGWISIIPFGGAAPYVTLRSVDETPAPVDASPPSSRGARAPASARGLSAVKQAATRFEVRSGPRGTTVECDVPVG